MNPRIPGVIFFEPAIGEIRVAALTLLDRLVIAFHRAGCEPITLVGEGTVPFLKRAQALGIKVKVCPTARVGGESTLVAFSELVVKPADVRRVIEQGGRLASRAGECLPLGVVCGWTGERKGSFDGLPVVRAEGVAERVTDRSTAVRAEKLLWDSLTSDTDGFVDLYFNRPVGRRLSKVLIHTPITPNQVSLASMIIGLLSAYCFSQGNHGLGVIGSILLQISAMVDCIDGDIARMVFKETRIGKWLDISADQIVHVAVFAAIAMGAGGGHLGSEAWVLGGSLVLGTAISFAVVLRGMLAPKRTAWAKAQRFIDQATSRDFSVLLVALALADRIGWFLWLAAIGVHVFWILVLVIQSSASREDRGRSESATRTTPGA